MPSPDPGTQGLDGFIVPRADEHLGEYVPARAERLAWLTGFTGSAGLAVRAAGPCRGVHRWALRAAARRTDGPGAFERRHITEEPPPAWLKPHAAPGARIGYDPWLISADALAPLHRRRADMVPAEPNPMDAVWTGPPGAAAAPRRAASARACRAQAVGREAGDARGRRCARPGRTRPCITDPASIAWLLNIRGGDVPTPPSRSASRCCAATARGQLFMDAGEAVPGDAGLARQRRRRSPDPAALPAALAALAGKTRAGGPAGSPVWFAQRLSAAGARRGGRAGPVPAAQGLQEPGRAGRARARRMPRDAGRGVPLPALAGHRPPADTTEMAAAAQLLAFRAGGRRASAARASRRSPAPGEQARSSITASAPRPTAPLGADEVYLIDSGAQFPDGTTDVTRTVWTGPGTAAGRAAGPLHARAAGPHRHRDRGVPAGCRRAASRRLRAARAVAGRARLRPRHRPRRRQLPVGA